MADKPRIKVALKPVDGGEAVQLLAAWDKEGGKLSASLDRSVEQIAIKLANGTVVRVTRGANGKASHYVNVYDNGSGGGGSYSAPRASKKPDPFNDGDDMPF